MSISDPPLLKTKTCCSVGLQGGSSPMIRNNNDSKIPTSIAFFDAKSAFDMVSHASLMRKVFHLGIDGVNCNLINSLHNGAPTVVKWDGRL